MKKLKNSSSPKTILIKSTPMTQAMELYNWLHRKSPNYSNLTNESLIGELPKECQSLVTVVRTLMKGIPEYGSPTDSPGHSTGGSQMKFMLGLWKNIVKEV